MAAEYVEVRCCVGFCSFVKSQFLAQILRGIFINILFQ